MIIWVPFSMAVAEDGTASIAGIPVEHLIREFSVQVDNDKFEAKFRLDEDNSKVSIPEKWANIWRRLEDRTAPDEEPIIRIRNARYIYANVDTWTICVDHESEIAVPDGITVALNSLSADAVKSKA